MALITSDCDAMRTHDHQMALITSALQTSLERKASEDSVNEERVRHSTSTAAAISSTTLITSDHSIMCYPSIK